MDFVALKAELSLDPVALGYGSLGDQGRADLLNQAGRTRARKVPLAEVWGYIDQQLIWPAILDLAANGIDANQRASALQSVEVRRYAGYEELDVNHPSFAIQTGLLVAGGVMTTAQADYLLALGTVPSSRAEELWGEGVVITAGHVGRSDNA